MDDMPEMERLKREVDRLAGALAVMGSALADMPFSNKSGRLVRWHKWAVGHIRETLAQQVQHD